MLLSFTTSRWSLEKQTVTVVGTMMIKKELQQLIQLLLLFLELLLNANERSDVKSDIEVCHIQATQHKLRDFFLFTSIGMLENLPF
mmetsp:Transcript_23136/g.58642  ORF Transcript_23136/g.58642 Transcript_23136/m.58642 type:complete len:86 (+) Transcript_23136:470-727(+)